MIFSQYSSDLNDAVISGAITFRTWNGATLNTPYKQGVTTSGMGVAISYYYEGYGIQLCLCASDYNIYRRIISGSDWSNFIK